MTRPFSLFRRPLLQTFLLALSLLMVWPHQTAASGILKLSRSELQLEPGSRPGELFAENRGDRPLYLEIEQQLLLNPGESPELLVSVGETQQPTLLVTPNRLMLAPGQKYKMGLNVLKAPARTQVWRVTFRPRERLILTPAEQADGLAAPLVISVGYGVLIYQMGEDSQSLPSQEKQRD